MAELAPALQSHHVWKDLAEAPSRSFGSSDDLSTLFTDWYSIQMLYSKCELTVPGDKLVALSGLAKDMKRHLAKLGCEDTGYLVGIWHARLPQALVWNVRDCGTRPATYRAPSWSWAAVDATVVMHDWRPLPVPRLLADVISARTTPLDPDDETGFVTGGVMTLRGKLFTAELHPYKRIEIINEAGRKIVSFQGIGAGEALFKVPDIRGNTWNIIFDTKEDISDKVFCLPVTWTESKFNDYPNWHVGGLALRRDDDGYRRVGCLSLEMIDDTLWPVLEYVAEREVVIL